MKFMVSTAFTGGALVISVEGELDLATVEQLAEPARVAACDGHPLVLDLSECSFIDSSGLRLVLQTHKAFAAGEKAMAVVVSDGQVQKVLSLTEINRIVRVFGGLDEAVASLGASSADGATETIPPATPAEETVDVASPG
jgi:anti-sigma B factor antagonist